jgi:predicted RNA binding protein YcfA (HicA-like mRNA interferase family)
MPKLPRISGAECVAVLKRMGFVQLRRGPKGCVVPMHRELKVGTLAGVLRRAGIDAEEFIKIWND